MKLINKKQTGFTLIELIIVIVILGILAVTAAPKFLNIQGDAHKATLNGLLGSMEAATSLVYGKAVIQGLQKSPNGDLKKVDGTTDIDTTYGYPDEAWTNTWAILVDASVEVVTTGNAPAGTPEFVAVEGDASASTAVDTLELKVYPASYWADGVAANVKACYISYDMDGTTATNTPVISIVDTDC